MMNDAFDGSLQRHYAQLLGVHSPWQVTNVNLDLGAKKVEIQLEYAAGQPVHCPVCQRSCRIKDHAPERVWRHLDTMQFATLLRARTPRADCPEHGVKNITVSWAEPGSHFTLLFERFAIEVLLASATLTQAMGLLRLSWDEVYRIQRRAVERGLARRQVASLPHVGLDEKSFRCGQSYISTLTDLAGQRVLEVVAGRTQEAADALWEKLPAEQRATVEAVALDMWEAFMNSTRQKVPQAALVHDKFHIAQHLNEAVDQVRRAENKTLRRQDDQTLNGTRWLWLMNPLKMKAEQQASFRDLKYSGLKVARAWALKELFCKLWHYRYEGAARRFFRQWYSWAIRSRLKPIKQVARMLQAHLDNVLTYLRHRITNAVAEGMNSKIQMLKVNARGFRNFENYRIRILFFCGKLELYP